MVDLVDIFKFRMKAVIVLFFIAIAGNVAAQDTEFWFVAPHASEQEVANYPLNVPSFLAISNGSSQPAHVQVYHYNGGTPVIYTDIIAPGEIYKIDYGDTTLVKQIENSRLTAGNVTQYGTHITSDVPVTAYYMINHPDSRDIFTLKGRSALGTEFYVPMQPGPPDHYDITQVSLIYK